MTPEQIDFLIGTAGSITGILLAYFFGIRPWLKRIKEKNEE